jgi:hypothetical protein
MVKDVRVEEIPGLYGSLKMDEIIVQKIWEEQDFLTQSLHTSCGKSIKVTSRGDWNRAEEGPDFKNAQLLIDGQNRLGDVEIHFQPSDWTKHRHDRNPNFNQVVLQVCVFPDSDPSKPQHVISENGKKIPTLFLLPFLYYGLEEYAEAYTLAKLSDPDITGHSNLDKISQVTEAEFEQLIASRWEAKLGFAKRRLERQGWERALHQWFLEVLGYRRNRGCMARISEEYPHTMWSMNKVDPCLAYDSHKDWMLRGCRPANHPLSRLKQYHMLWKCHPGWMSGIRDLAQIFRGKNSDVKGEREKIRKLDKQWKEVILKNVFSSTKANTIWVDCVLPLLSVDLKINGYELWKQWPAGDCPRHFRDYAKNLNWAKESGKELFTNGLVQGIIRFSSVSE